MLNNVLYTPEQRHLAQLVVVLDLRKVHAEGAQRGRRLGELDEQLCGKTG